MAQQSSMCVAVAILLSLQTVVSARTNLLHSSPKTLTFELTERGHHNVSKTTFFPFPVRTREDVQQSHDRAAYFAHRLNGGGSASTEALQSPVRASKGEFSMEIQLGTPPKPYTVIMDTGSDLNWIQCKPCSPCMKQPSPSFDPATSSTYNTVSCSAPLCRFLGSQGTCGGGNVCSYSYLYGDRSETHGNLGTDVLTYDTGAGRSTFGKLTFGCAHSTKGEFAGTDGLVGLGRGALSLNSQMASALPNKFAYCMVDRASGKTSTLLLGEVPAHGLTYTPLLYSPVAPTFYAVEVQGIAVSGKAVNIPEGGFGKEVIFDSGTTITVLGSGAFEAVVAAVANVVSYKTVSPDEGAPLELCWDVSGVESPVFPSLTFTFGGGAVFHMTPINNIIAVDGNYPIYCFAMTASDQDISIIGNNQQINHIVVYDNEANRIGFATRTC